VPPKKPVDLLPFKKGSAPHFRTHLKGNVMSNVTDTSNVVRRPADTYRRPAHRRWRLSAEEGQRLIALREQGKSWRCIARETGINSHAIVRELKALGLPTTPFSQRMTLSDDEIELVVAMRAQGRFVSYVEAEMGVSWYVISRELKARGISTARATAMQDPKRTPGFWGLFGDDPNPAKVAS
jgi:hypothetical protein